MSYGVFLTSIRSNDWPEEIPKKEGFEYVVFRRSYNFSQPPTFEAYCKNYKEAHKLYKKLAKERDENAKQQRSQ